MSDIPDEAVEAAARVLCINILEYGDCQGHGNFTRGKQYCSRGYSTAEIALTAAAPLIAAQATAELRARIEALRDEWRTQERTTGGTIDDLYECANDLHRVIEGARG